MNLELRSLRHAVALARTLNFRKAADELGITQSTLTRSIQATEQTLNARLFDRDRSGVKVTPVGREFINRAELVIHSSDELTDAMERIARGQAGAVSFGMGPLVAKMILPELLSNQLTISPNLRFSVIVRGFAQLMPLLLAEEIDFFIASPPRSSAVPSRVEAVTLGELPISLLVRKEHPLLRPGALEQWAGPQHPLYASSIREMPFQLIAQASTFVESTPAIVSDDSDLLSRMTRSTDGIWLSSTPVARDEIGQGLLAKLPVNLPPPNTFAFVRYSLRTRSQSPASRALMTRARTLVRRYSQGGS